MMSHELLNAPRPSQWTLLLNRLKAFFHRLTVFFAPTVNLENLIQHHSFEVIQAQFQSLSRVSKVKSLQVAFSEYKAQDFCDALVKHPSELALISQLMSALTMQEKIQILLQQALDKKTPITVLGMLLWQGDKNKAILAGLFQGLSSGERIEVLTELYNYSHALGQREVTPEVLAILFENVTSDDRLKFLSTIKHNRSILMHIVSKGQVNRPSQSKQIQEIKIKTLEILFKDLKAEQLTPTLTYKVALSPEALIWLGLDESFLQKGGVTAVDIALHDNNIEVARFLIQSLTTSTFNAPESVALSDPFNIQEAADYKRLR